MSDRHARFDAHARASLANSDSPEQTDIGANAPLNRVKRDAWSFVCRRRHYHMEIVTPAGFITHARPAGTRFCVDTRGIRPTSPSHVETSSVVELTFVPPRSVHSHTQVRVPPKINDVTISSTPNENGFGDPICAGLISGGTFRKRARFASAFARNNAHRECNGCDNFHTFNCTFGFHIRLFLF